MKNLYLFIWSFVLLFSVISAQAQKTVQQQKSITSAEFQKAYSEQEETTIKQTAPYFQNPKAAEINWQLTDPAGINFHASVSKATGEILGGFELNNERFSVFGNSSTPLWEHSLTTEWGGFPLSRTPDGAFIAFGGDNELAVFAHDNSTPIWYYTFSGSSEGIAISADASLIYVDIENYNGAAGTTILCFEVGNETPVWSSFSPGKNYGMTASKDLSVLAWASYDGEYSALHILDATNGNEIFTTPNTNQVLPAISHDGKIIVRGDYSGYMYVYEFSDELENYQEKWRYHFSYGTSSNWVVAPAVSGDGKTIAGGSLSFMADSYDGEIAIFNTYSSTPIWTYTGLGDEISNIDLSYDGSIIAAVGYGPMDNSKPDFFLFRRNSPTPYFTHSTSGSMFDVDLSDDGSFCSFGGKLVHARVMGSGGLLYSVNSHPGGATLEGMVNLTDSDNNQDARIDIPELDAYFGLSDESGSYQIPYIPQGSYTVVASKVGYYPQTFENANFVDGEVTQLDFEMENTGNPPSQFLASKGAYEYVQLQWLAPQEKDYIGFHIYRKNVSEEPFPNEPMATIDADALSFNDDTALPNRTYIYAVTANLGEGVQSAYTNTDEGWVSDGFITTDISVYIGLTPTIDGIISDGEWDDAFAIDCSDFGGTYDGDPVPVGSVMGYYKMNADATEMYVAYYNLNDTELEDHDEVAIYIDDNNDGVFPPDGIENEGNYWAAHYASGDVIKYRPLHSPSGSGDIIYLDNPQIAVSIEAGYVVYEFVIPMGQAEDWQIMPSDNNKSGIGIFVLDDPSAFDAWWPNDNTDIFSPEAYGTLHFGATDEVPPAPLNLSASLISDFYVALDWNKAPINDFDHYNVYSQAGKAFEIIGFTQGNQFYYELPTEGFYEFYITTVDQAGNESEASEIVAVEFYVGTSTLEQASIVNTFPNPFKELVTLQFSVEEKTQVGLNIRNMDAQIIYKQDSKSLSAGNHQFQWKPTKGISAGVYFYELSIGETIYRGKIVLQ